MTPSPLCLRVTFFTLLPSRVKCTMPGVSGYKVSARQLVTCRRVHHALVTLLYRCPKYNHETEGGITVLISALKFWNSIPTDIRSNSDLLLLVLTLSLRWYFFTPSL